jgi:hypothetical protein
MDGLQLVLSKRNPIGDSNHNIYCSPHMISTILDTDL